MKRLLLSLVAVAFVLPQEALAQDTPASISVAPADIHLSAVRDRQQIIVQAVMPNGLTADVTDQVTWSVVPFNNSYAPGKKNFDFDINQISITPERAAVVDFSDGYYTVNQAVVALKSSKIADAKTLADLQGAKLGAQVGTTAYTAIKDQIQQEELKECTFNPKINHRARDPSPVQSRYRQPSPRRMQQQQLVQNARVLPLPCPP